jgi:hypothetical protein
LFRFPVPVRHRESAQDYFPDALQGRAVRELSTLRWQPTALFGGEKATARKSFDINAKFGMHRGAIEDWIDVGRRVKYTPPGALKQLTKKPSEAFEQQVKAAAVDAHDAVLAEGPAASIEPQPAKGGHRGGTTRQHHGLPADRPGEPITNQPPASASPS